MHICVFLFILNVFLFTAFVYLRMLFCLFGFSAIFTYIYIYIDLFYFSLQDCLSLFCSPRLSYSLPCFIQLSSFSVIVETCQIWTGFAQVSVRITAVIHYIAKSIGTPSNERFDYFSNFHDYKS